MLYFKNNKAIFPKKELWTNVTGKCQNHLTKIDLWFTLKEDEHQKAERYYYKFGLSYRCRNPYPYTDTYHEDMQKQNQFQINTPTPR